MRLLKSLLLASAAGLLAVSAAAAADLPTKKTPPAAEKLNCFASFWTWLDSTAADCPLSAYGITVYGTIDMAAGYETHASKFNNNFNNGVAELISKSSGNARWQLVPNGLSQSNVGIKIKEQVAPDWYVIGDVNTGFDPYSMRLADGPQSLVDNNGLSNTAQSANGDSSRAGQWDNTRAYAGLSNKTFGTLTAGRQYAFSNDLANNYDPTGGSYAFSLIGSSGTPVAGLGDTELARYNTSVKYQFQYNIVRAGAMVQLGNYSQGNGAENAYQFDIGGDFAGFSLDGIYSHAEDAVFLASFSAPVPVGDANDLKATIANVDSWALAGKYKNGPFQVFAGYANDRLTDPTDSYATSATNGFTGIGDFDVPAGQVTLNAYNHGAKILQTAWVGAKYGILSNLDIAGGYYYEWQNNYSGTACASAIGNKACAGHEPVYSGLLDWRPVKRVDVYAGVMYSALYGGLANGYKHPDGTAWTNPNNTAFTTGVRVNF